MSLDCVVSAVIIMMCVFRWMSDGGISWKDRRVCSVQNVHGKECKKKLNWKTERLEWSCEWSYRWCDILCLCLLCFQVFILKLIINITRNTPGQVKYLLATGLTEHERLVERSYILPSTLLMILRLNFLFGVIRSYTEHPNIILTGNQEMENCNKIPSI